MGIGCCNKINKKDDLFDDFEKISQLYENYSIKYDKNSSNYLCNCLTEKDEKIIFEISHKNETFSLLFLSKINEIRTNPLLFFSESKKYHLSDFFEKFISNSENSKIIPWSYEKASEIYDIMDDDKNGRDEKKLNKIKKINEKLYEVDILSNLIYQTEKIMDYIWQYLKNLNKEELEKLLIKKYDCVVIYTFTRIEEDTKDLGEIQSFRNLKEYNNVKYKKNNNNKKKDIYNIFIFLFNKISKF